MRERVGPMDLGESQALFEASLDEAAKLDKHPLTEGGEPEPEALPAVEIAYEARDYTSPIAKMVAKTGFAENDAKYQLRQEIAALAARGELNDDNFLELYLNYQTAGYDPEKYGDQERAMAKLLLEADLLALYGHADAALETIEESIGYLGEGNTDLPLLHQAAEILRQQLAP